MAKGYGSSKITQPEVSQTFMFFPNNVNNDRTEQEDRQNLFS